MIQKRKEYTVHGECCEMVLSWDKGSDLISVCLNQLEELLIYPEDLDALEDLIKELKSVM